MGLTSRRDDGTGRLADGTHPPPTRHGRRHVMCTVHALNNTNNNNNNTHKFWTSNYYKKYSQTSNETGCYYQIGCRNVHGNNCFDCGTRLPLQVSLVQKTARLHQLPSCRNLKGINSFDLIVHIFIRQQQHLPCIKSCIRSMFDT